MTKVSLVSAVFFLFWLCDYKSFHKDNSGQTTDYVNYQEEYQSWYITASTVTTIKGLNATRGEDSFYTL